MNSFEPFEQKNLIRIMYRHGDTEKLQQIRDLFIEITGDIEMKLLNETSSRILDTEETDFLKSLRSTGGLFNKSFKSTRTKHKPTLNKPTLKKVRFAHDFPRSILDSPLFHKENEQLLIGMEGGPIGNATDQDSVSNRPIRASDSSNAAINTATSSSFDKNAYINAELIIDNSSLEKPNNPLFKRGRYMHKHTSSFIENDESDLTLTGIREQMAHLII